MVPSGSEKKMASPTSRSAAFTAAPARDWASAARGRVTWCSPYAQRTRPLASKPVAGSLPRATARLPSCPSASWAASEPLPELPSTGVGVRTATGPATTGRPASGAAGAAPAITLPVKTAPWGSPPCSA